MIATLPLWVGIPIFLVALLGVLSLAVAVGLVLEAGHVKRCPCVNCAALRAEHMDEKLNRR